MTKVHNMAMELRAAYLSMHRQTNAHLLQHGVTADQFVCLVILEEEDGITQQELTRRATSDPNTMRAMLMLLEKCGLVTREKHPHDRRARIVRITQKGRQICKKLTSELDPVRDRMVSLFGEKETDKLVEYLRRISDALRAVNNSIG